jgi:hypothetical protein
MNAPQPGPEQRQKAERLAAMPLADVVAYLTRGDDIPTHTDIQYELARREILAAGEVVVAMTAAKASADRASTWLIVFSAVIAALTVALVILTAVLVVRH